jgi:hypothetical protein
MALNNMETVRGSNDPAETLFAWSLLPPNLVFCSVAEPHHFYASPAPAPGKNFDAAPDPAALAPAPTLLYSKEKFLKQTKV